MQAQNNKNAFLLQKAINIRGGETVKVLQEERQPGAQQQLYTKGLLVGAGPGQDGNYLTNGSRRIPSKTDGDFNTVPVKVPTTDMR